MRDDERQRVLVFRADVNEMNVETVDLGDEVRIRIQLRLDLAPVVFGRPVAGELLNRRELNALRSIRDRFPFRKPCRFDTPAKVDELLFRKLDVERPDCTVSGCRGSRMLGKHAQGSGGSNTNSSTFNKTAAIMVDVFQFHGKIPFALRPCLQKYRQGWRATMRARYTFVCFAMPTVYAAQEKCHIRTSCPLWVDAVDKVGDGRVPALIPSF